MLFSLIEWPLFRLLRYHISCRCAVGCWQTFESSIKPIVSLFFYYGYRRESKGTTGTLCHTRITLQLWYSLKCKQFAPWSDTTRRWAWSIPKLLDILMSILEEGCDNFDFKKDSEGKKCSKLLSMQRVNNNGYFIAVFPQHFSPDDEKWQKLFGLKTTLVAKGHLFWQLCSKHYTILTDKSRHMQLPNITFYKFLLLKRPA